MSILSCAGKRPSNLGISGGVLAACPSSPNCISSDATDKPHQIEPFQIEAGRADIWKIVRGLVLQLPRTKIIESSTEYIHAECRSAVFGFVDDLELHYRPAENLIAVRSASRLGHSDFGANRRRIELLRASFSNSVVHR